MIKKLETQDQYGNKIYRYTSSDIVLDTDTGHTVKQDIDLILAALGINNSGVNSSATTSDVNINANTLQGYAAADFVQATAYTNSIKALSDELAKRAPIDSPALTGTPTTPSVDIGNNSETIANTKYVDDTATSLREEITKTLEGYALVQHTHPASDIISGEFAVTNIRAKDGSDYTASRIRNIAFIGESEDIPETLSNGSLLFTYEG
jgi:hypothetical protein